LYTGDLLAGLKVRGCPGFEDWLFLQQETQRELLFDVLNRLAVMSAARHDFHAAMACTRELLTLDPLYEEGHRRLMWLYARTGRRGAALRQFRTCAAALAAELQAAPSAATRALLEQIAAGEIV
jgi:DNA-binding SARP family transcriptional activator